MFRFLLILGLVIGTNAVCFPADVYKIKPSISNEELQRTYEKILLTFSRYAEGRWTDLEWGAGYWGNGISGGNEGIRAVANTALVYAVLARETDALRPGEREHCIRRATSGIRYAAETHITGAQQCVNGKQWGDSWQSAMWTGNMGFAAWILGDALDPDLRESVERVVIYEADRFLEMKPPGKRWGDTKAEENGWDLICISLAANMLPDHPNAGRWREKAVEYMMNVISVPKDARDETIVDGRPIKDWVSTVNVHPDFTLENHGFFHPSYLMVSAAELGQGATMFAYAGQPVPEAASHHVMDNWRLAQTFMLPSAYWGFAQGMDWIVNTNGHTMYLSWLATRFDDPLAAGMEKILAQYIAGNQLLHGDGSMYGPSNRMGFGREAIHCERISYAYMQHKLFGSPEAQRTVRDMAYELNGVRRYMFIDVMTHRTDSKFTSFSWKNQNMGYLAPTGPGNESNPFFTTPISTGFVGRFDVEGSEETKPVVENRTWRKTPDGFETDGIRTTNGGLLRQTMKFASVGEKTVVLMDCITAVQDVTINAEFGIPFAIENDEFTGNRRTLYHADGVETIIGPEKEEIIRIPGRWANVDGRLGVVSILGSGMAYKTVQGYTRDGAREDILFASFSNESRTFKAGDEVARRASVFFVETSPEQTAYLAERVRVQGNTLFLTLPEGGEYQARM